MTCDRRTGWSASETVALEDRSHRAAGGRGRWPASAAGRGRARTTTSAGRSGGGQLAQQRLAALGERDETDPFVRRTPWPGPGVTMPPSHGPQLMATVRQFGRARVEPLGRLVQHLVGGRVRDLPGPSEPAGGRREQDDGLERVGGGRGEQVAAGRSTLVDVDVLELLVGQVLDLAVGQDAGPVDEGRDRPEPRRERRRGGGQGRRRPARRPGGTRPSAPASRNRRRLRRTSRWARIRLYSSPTSRGVVGWSTWATIACLIDASSSRPASQSGSASGTGVRPSRTSFGANGPGQREQRLGRDAAAAAGHDNDVALVASGLALAATQDRRFDQLQRDPALARTARPRPGRRSGSPRRYSRDVPAGRAGSMSIALHATCGHSCAAVLREPGEAPRAPGLRPASSEPNPKAPSSRVTVAKNAPLACADASSAGAARRSHRNARSGQVVRRRFRPVRTG